MKLLVPRCEDGEHIKHTETASNQIDGVVMLKIKSGPPDPQSVGVKDPLSAGEDVAQKQSLNGGRSGVQGRHSAKNHRGSRESRRIQIDAKQLIDSCKPCRRARHGVVGWSQSMQDLVPRRCTWEQNLDRNTNDVHVTEAPSEDR